MIQLEWRGNPGNPSADHLPLIMQVWNAGVKHEKEWSLCSINSLPGDPHGIHLYCCTPAHTLTPPAPLSPPGGAPWEGSCLRHAAGPTPTVQRQRTRRLRQVGLSPLS